MKNKILVMFLLAISSVVLLPSVGNAKTSDSKSNASESKTITELTKTETLSQRRRRGGYREDRRGRSYRNYGQYRRAQNRRARLIRQTYYRNGRRYTRVIRVY